MTTETSRGQQQVAGIPGLTAPIEFAEFPVWVDDDRFREPHSFTLADSFYDAQAGDVFLQQNAMPRMVRSQDETVAYAGYPPVQQESIPPPVEPPHRPSVVAHPPPVERPGAVRPQAGMAVAHPIAPKPDRRHLSPEIRMQETFRIPVYATLVFVVTMFAIYYLGDQVGGYYAPVVQGEKVEFVGRPSNAK